MRFVLQNLIAHDQYAVGYFPELLLSNRLIGAIGQHSRFLRVGS